MITLWGRLTSSNVQKIVWALAELRLDYEHIPWGGRFGGNQNVDYLAMNPNGLVPTLRDGDLVLWESHAILRYLSATYGAGSLWPADPRGRALADQWTDWTATTFQPAWTGLFWNFFRTPPGERDGKAIEKAIAATNRCFALMDARLATAPYLGGAALSYADMSAGVAMYRMTTLDIALTIPAHVAAWHARLNDREAYRVSVNVDYEELRARLAF
jgi:glutathione S-transferase